MSDYPEEQRVEDLKFLLEGWLKPVPDERVLLQWIEKADNYDADFKEYQKKLAEADMEGKGYSRRIEMIKAEEYLVLNQKRFQYR